MGYALLFVEALAFSLLLPAVLLAYVARMERRRFRIVAALLVLLVPLGVYATLTGLAGYFQLVVPVTDRWFLPLGLVTASYLVGGVWLFWRSSEAAAWPRARLAAACGVAAILTLMTFWNLDLAVRQQLALLRTKVSALALSEAPASVPDRDNAALLYDRAFTLLKPSEEEPSFSDEWDDRWGTWMGQAESDDLDPDDPDLVRFLERWTPAVEALLEASKRPDCSFGHNYAWPSFDMLLPELPQVRQSSHLLSLQARADAARGNGAAALRCVQAMLTLADHTSAEPILISLLVGIAIDDLAITALSHVLSEVPLSEEDISVLELEESFSYGRRFRRALRMEEAFGISVLCDAAGAGGVDLLQEYGFAAWPPLASLYRVFLLGQDVAAYRGGLKEFQQLASEPYHRSKPQWDTVVHWWYRGPQGLLTRHLIPSFVGCAKQVAQGDARRRLARILVDVHRYRAREGRLPQSLEDLVPAITTFVPIDPFDGQPLRLGRKDAYLIAYSIGPDGEDNGGTALDSDSKTGDIVLRVAPLSGDR
jgi:hypothetical protein